MLNTEKAREAFNAIWAAQPHWTPQQVRRAIQAMPTTVAWTEPKGTSARERLENEHAQRLQEWLQRVLYTPNAPPLDEPDYAAIRADIRANGPAKVTAAAAPSKASASSAPVATSSALLKPGSKKQRVLMMLKQPGGVTVDMICKELGVSEPAAKALIGDVKRAGQAVNRNGETYSA